MCFRDMKQQKFGTFLTLVFLSLLLPVTAGCDKNKKNSKLNSASYENLSIKGRLTTEDGTPVKNGKIYLPGSSDPSSLTNDNGFFSLTLNDTEITDIKYRDYSIHGQTEQEKLTLFFENSASDNLLTGSSDTLAYEDRGEKDIGQIIMKKPVAISGTVKLMKSEGKEEPVKDIKLVSGRSVITCDDQGRFSLRNLNHTGTKIFAFGENTSVSITTFKLKPGDVIDLGFPIFVFPKGTIAGALIPLPKGGDDQLLGYNNLARMNFKVESSPEAKYVRLSHDRAKLNDSLEGETWREISSEMIYDFPDSGTQAIYYQFTDSSKSNRSEIAKANINIDPFIGSKGITIGDGSGFSKTREVAVHVDVPAGAVQMRFSEDPLQLIGTSGVPFMKAESEASFVFAVKRSGPDNMMLETNFRRLYCQFKSDKGILSSVYSASVVLSSFDDSLDDESVFRVLGGAREWGSLLVPLEIHPPEGAVEMRIFNEYVNKPVIDTSVVVKPDDRQNNVQFFMQVQEKYDYLFIKPGHQQLFLQFRDKDGITSRFYRTEVMVLRSVIAGYGFSINNGAPKSELSEVTLQLVPPPGAMFYRVSEDKIKIASMPFSTLTPEIKFLTSGMGMRTLYLQYADIDGTISNSYTQNIYIDPFGIDPGNFIVNGNIGGDATVTDTPIIMLTVMPPKAATQMEVTEAIFSSYGIPTCNLQDQTVTPSPVDSFLPIIPNPQGVVQLEFIIQGTGPHMLCMRFKTLSGLISPYLTRSVIYDPFTSSIPGNEAVIAIIGDDYIHDPIVTSSREVKISLLSRPKRARSLKIASSADAISTAVMQPIIPEFNYYLAKGSSQSGDLYTVYIQFITENGELSPVYQSSIHFNPFPQRLLSVQISASKNTDTTDLNLGLTPPESARQVRISESSDFTSNMVVRPVSAGNAHIIYRVDGTAGTKSVFLKYIDESGNESPVFSGSIVL
ncbi:MAG: hypothetical protein HQK54_07455 [Oligoflexales bacterium]|nr:hypothetical protein [Oligoflexales bacterium]